VVSEPRLEDHWIVAVCDELSLGHVGNARPCMSRCFQAQVRVYISYHKEQGVHFEVSGLSCNGSLVRGQYDWNDRGRDRKLGLMI
jgi:hypothetical protein